MSEVRPQLLVTVVHGTKLFPRLSRFKQWMRGLTRRKPPLPSWFEEGSVFLAVLSTELGDIQHKITRLRWSGANSISVRDSTARRLAEHLSAEHAAHAEATQLVIAHSHGGNIALRSLHHLQDREVSPHGADIANPLVVTLATPFIEIHQADYGNKPSLIRAAVLCAIYVLLELLTVWLFPSARSDLPNRAPLDMAQSVNLIFRFVVGLSLVLIAWHWIERRAVARNNKLQALSSATRLGEAVSPQRLLVIRAIDDEASLGMALGTIVNYLTTISIVMTYRIMFALGFSMLPVWLFVNFFIYKLPHYPSWYIDLAQLFCAVVIVALFGLVAVSRLVHGSELAKSPMECQVNTQSTPDATGLSKIVSLVRRTDMKSLRHGIYDNEDCPKVISDWVHSQLCAQPAR
ncbi:hypothetical protein [Bradyrhizobium sp. DASA03120]|uniref:hypothetical protein n=1 Tax=Bradyrhizobium sp. SMVTL-02 TaxID=3395917 RepID=UPI003F6F8145